MVNVRRFWRNKSDNIYAVLKQPLSYAFVNKFFVVVLEIAWSLLDGITIVKSCLSIDVMMTGSIYSQIILARSSLVSRIKNIMVDEDGWGHSVLKFGGRQYESLWGHVRIDDLRCRESWTPILIVSPSLSMSRVCMFVVPV